MRVALALLLLSSGVAMAQTVDPAVRRQPDDIEIKDVWPVAGKDFKEARVVLQCRVAPENRFESCQVISEAPAGAQFGAVARNYALGKLALKVGDQPGTFTTLPMHFDRPEKIPRQMEYRFTVIKWDRAPTWEQVRAAYPPQAKADDAVVLLRCGIDVEGRLSACKTLGEDARGQGFADAARTLAPLFKARLEPAVAETLGPGSTVEIFTHFMRDAGGRKLKAVQWTRTVDLEEANQLYPSQATKAGVDKGEANLQCQVTEEGGLTDCRAISETPTGLGFGAAAVRMAASMQINRWTISGIPVGGLDLTFPVKFSGP